MKKATSIKDWQRMFNELTDAESIQKAKRLAERKKRKEMKIADTGL